MVMAAPELNDVVYDCCEQCLESSLPQASLATYIQRLRRDSDFTDDEILEVEATAKLLIWNHFDHRLATLA